MSKYESTEVFTVYIAFNQRVRENQAISLIYCDTMKVVNIWQMAEINFQLDNVYRGVKNMEQTGKIGQNGSRTSDLRD